MTDRELVEMAAKAAGYDDAKFQDMEGWGEVRYGLSCGIWSEKHLENYWNPLVNDGDALRLAVKLGFGISVPLSNERTDVVTFGRTLLNAIEAHNGNPYAATRRAIVRAAAALADAGGRDE